ncbi:MAG: cytochrome c [Alphaproteobacteria bacterium]|nr:cytochrome c [Alphaproteobacteria bacterium]
MIADVSKAFVAGAVMLVLGAGAAYAALSGDEAIKARQACMKANGAAMGVMVPIIKGEKPYDAAAVQAALGGSEAACAKWSEFWPEDSKVGKDVKTRALEAIWTDAKTFEETSNAEYTAFTALKATTDEASFKAAFPALGAACGSCHEKFRAPQQ